MRDSVKLPIYYTVIGIRIDSYESTIEHERHFRDEVSALEYAENLRQEGLVTVMLFYDLQAGQPLTPERDDDKMNGGTSK